MSDGRPGPEPAQAQADTDTDTDTDQAALSRKRVVVHGLVQGVGFRATCSHRARKMGLHGYVRNRADGSVEAVFEGPPGLVESMVQWCRHGPEFARVQGLDVFDEEAVGERPFSVS